MAHYYVVLRPIWKKNPSNKKSASKFWQMEFWKVPEEREQQQVAHIAVRSAREIIRICKILKIIWPGSSSTRKCGLIATSTRVQEFYTADRLYRKQESTSAECRSPSRVSSIMYSRIRLFCNMAESRPYISQYLKKFHRSNSKINTIQMIFRKSLF